MGAFESSKATLRFIGDDLAPDELSRLLGCEPDYAHTKGQTVRNRIKDFGQWRVTTEICTPESLDSQIVSLLQKLTNDLNVWIELKKKYRVELFCYLGMQSGNDGVSLSAELLRQIAERQIELQLDIYSPTEERIQLETKSICDAESFHLTCQKVFGLPVTYAKNFDALLCCFISALGEEPMTNISLSDGKCIEIQISDFKDFAERLPEVCSQFLKLITYVNLACRKDNRFEQIHLIL